jgi:hypothetical protein
MDWGIPRVLLCGRSSGQDEFRIWTNEGRDAKTGETLAKCIVELRSVMPLQRVVATASIAHMEHMLFRPAHRTTAVRHGGAGLLGAPGALDALRTFQHNV